MPEIIHCPACGRKLRLPDEFLGRQVRCPSCQNLFQAALPYTPTGAETPPLPGNAVLTPIGPPPPRDLPLPPPPRISPAPAPTPSRGWTAGKLLILCAVLGTIFVAGILLLALWLRNDDDDFKPFIRNEPDIRFKEPEQAVAKPVPLTDLLVEREIKPFFDRLGRALKQNDQAAAVKQIDLDRLGNLILDRNPVPDWYKSNRNRVEFVQGMRRGFDRTLTTHFANILWDQTEIRNVKKFNDTDFVVIVRHKIARNTTTIYRWWITRNSGAWQAYDWEDLYSSMRVSNIWVQLVPEIGNGAFQLRELSRRFREMQDIDNAISSSDFDTAERILDNLPRAGMPDYFEALRNYNSGVVLYRRNQPQKALDAWAAAERLNRDILSLDHLRGMAYGDLNQWEKSLQHPEAFHKVLGDEQNVCRELGLALRLLRRFPEAAVNYRKALDDNPQDDIAFRGLMNSLQPGSKKAELAERFPKLREHKDTFMKFAQELRNFSDFEALEGLAEAMRKLDSRFAPADYYLALALVETGQVDESVKTFRRAVRNQTDPALRKEYAASYLPALARRGKAVDAYLMFPDSHEAFRLLALALKKGYYPEELGRLVEAHSKKEADDPLLPWFRGEMLVLQNRYAEADKVFSDGLAKLIDVDLVFEFRSSRVLARYHTGKMMSAYDEIGPKSETFQQLAHLCLFDKKLDDLQKLLDLHAKTDPENPKLTQFRFQLRIHQGRLDEAAAIFKAALAKETRAEEKRNIEAIFFNTMVDENKLVEAYQSAPDAHAAFLHLARDLYDQGREDDLTPLLELHRKKHPDDPWLAYYAAENHLREEEWDKAAQTLSTIWERDGPTTYNTFRNTYVYALAQAGKHLQAYQLVTPRKQTFDQLANILYAARKGTALKELVEVHRPHGSDDPEFRFAQCRVELLLRQPEPATEFFRQAVALQPSQSLREGYAYTFVTEMAEMGRALEAYQCCPDKKRAFEDLAILLNQRKKSDDLERLLQLDKEHPNWACFQGDLLLLRGQIAEADRVLSEFKEKMPGKWWMARNPWLRARIGTGKTVATLHELGDTYNNFQDLAGVCITEKNPDQLERLIAEYRKIEPRRQDLPLWDLDLLLLQSKNAEAFELIKTHREGILAKPDQRWKRDDRTVRCLIRLKKSKEALAEAETIVKEKHGDRFLLLLAHAANGDADKAIAVAKKFRVNSFTLQTWYSDKDLGPLLRSPSLAAFRAKYPEPKK